LAEAITIISRVHNIYNGGTGIIKEDGSKVWYSKYINYAINNGLIAAEASLRLRHSVQPGPARRIDPGPEQRIRRYASCSPLFSMHPVCRFFNNGM